VQQVNGYPYTDSVELQERLPMLTADEAGSKQQTAQTTDLAEQPAPTVYFAASFSTLLLLYLTCILVKNIVLR